MSISTSTTSAPTRITIEVHHAGEPGSIDGMPSVRVVPDGEDRVAHAGFAAAHPREDAPSPAAYDPGPCLCLDDEDCGADHAND